MSEKENQGNNEQIPVFRIKPSNSTSEIIKYVGFYTKNEKLLDELVEFDQHENTLKHINYDNNTIYFYIITTCMYLLCYNIYIIIIFYNISKIGMLGVEGD